MATSRKKPAAKAKPSWKGKPAKPNAAAARKPPQAAAEPKPRKVRAAAAAKPPAPEVKRSARQILIDACSRVEGATSKELYEQTGWKFASWSHQLRLAAKSTGWTSEIAKVDGTTRYFLRQPGEMAA